VPGLGVDRAPVDPATPRTLRLRPCDEDQFSLRDADEGFADTDIPQTIFLGDRVPMNRPEPLCVAVQPGVADPPAERAQRTARRDAYLARRPAVCRLPRAIVDTAAFVICPDEHRYLHDSVRTAGHMEWFGYSASDDGMWTRAIDAISEREERIVVLGAQTNYNFSHWLLESVARALLFAPFDDGSWRYLTPRLDPWQRQTLDLIGLAPDRVLELEPAGLARFPEVIAVSRGMTRMREFVPAAIAALAALGRGTEGRRRLYVSRARTNVRGISNEPDVAELFVRHGFDVVCPETLPFAKQVELFASAGVIAGPHGSGLTGVLFAPPGALVIELQPERQRAGVVEYLWNLCAVLGHSFAQVVCRHAPGTEDVPVSHREVTVDVSHLDRVLTSVLAG